MIEVHLDLYLFEITRMEGFPNNPNYDEIYKSLISVVWDFREPSSDSQVLIALGSYLSKNYPSNPWKVVAFADNVEVSRIEFQTLDASAPVSRLRASTA